MSKEQPLLSPSHSHTACPATPTQQHQHNATNTQHFTNQQHTSMLYHTNANSINTADMQNSQFCYDRTSVPLYSSGEAQDARSLPPSNPVNHQMGGKSYDHLMSCDHQKNSIIQITTTPQYSTYTVKGTKMKFNAYANNLSKFFIRAQQRRTMQFPASMSITMRKYG